MLKLKDSKIHPTSTSKVSNLHMMYSLCNLYGDQSEKIANSDGTKELNILCILTLSAFSVFTGICLFLVSLNTTLKFNFN